jgi:hypothetical protein
VRKNLWIVTIVLLAGFAAGCNRYDAATANANLNSNVAGDAPATRPAPDNSEIATTVDANGVKTETRTFRNNPRISKVVVTTRNGVRTARVTTPSGEEKDLDDNKVAEALEAAGDKVADAAGFVADAAGDVGREAADKAEDVKDQTVSGAKTVGEKTVEGSKTVAEGAKKVATKTASGTKKAIKKVIP